MIAFTRRAAMLGAAVLAAAGRADPSFAAGDGAEPRALLAFDDDALAERARPLLRAKGFEVDPVDLRRAGVGFRDIGRAAVMVVACSDAGNARAFARSTALAFRARALLFGPGGWSSYRYSEAQQQWDETGLDEARAGAALEAVLREHAARPRPLIRA